MALLSKKARNDNSARCYYHECEVLDTVSKKPMRIDIEKLATDLARAMHRRRMENRRQRQLSALHLGKQCGDKQREKRI